MHAVAAAGACAGPGAVDERMMVSEAGETGEAPWIVQARAHVEAGRADAPLVCAAVERVPAERP